MRKRGRKREGLVILEHSVQLSQFYFAMWDGRVREADFMMKN